ncbi:MAG: AAA domain-containing protein [Merdibacter sp.]
MCEGFQLTVLLKEYVGNYINSAHLTVAPWKLLRALHNRLDALNKENEIAMKLLDIDITKERKAISDIPMGQDNAINNSINNPISIIWGPPGTGKTYTMAQIAMRFLLQGKTLLMVSHSNISVDGLITELYNQIRISKDNKLHALVEQGKILRYGFVHSEKLSKNQKVVSFSILL